MTADTEALLRIIKSFVVVLAEIEGELLGVLGQGTLDVVGNAPTREALTDLCARVRQYRSTVTRYVEAAPQEDTLRRWRPQPLTLDLDPDVQREETP